MQRTTVNAHTLKATDQFTLEGSDALHTVTGHPHSGHGLVTLPTDHGDITISRWADVVRHVQPEVGMGATMLLPSDTYPYVVVKVGPTYVDVVEVPVPPRGEDEPSRGFPIERWTADQDALDAALANHDSILRRARLNDDAREAAQIAHRSAMRRARLHNDGRYRFAGSDGQRGPSLMLGDATYTRNWED